METEKEKFLVANKKQLGGKQVLVECVINLENGEQLEKVLSLGVDAKIKTIEVFEKEAKFTGEIFATLLYLTPSGEIGSVASACPFQDSSKNEGFNPQNKVVANAKVVAITPSSSNEGTFKMIVNVEVNFTETSNQPVKSYYSTDEKCCTKLQGLDLNVLTHEANADFSVQSKIAVKENISKVLLVDSSVVLKETTVGTGFVSLSGEVCGFVCYVKEDGSVAHAQVVEQFKEEVEVKSSSNETIIEAYLNEKKSEVKAVVENQGEKSNLIVITTPIQATVRAFEQENIPVTTDVYSLTNEVEIIKGNFSNSKMLGNKYFESKVEGSLSLPESNPRIDKILLLSSPRMTISNSYYKDGEVFVDGIIYANVIYLNDDTSTINSVEIEVPFVINDKVAFENDKVYVYAQAILSDCDVIAKKGREIYFDCKVKTYLNMWEDENYELVSGINIGKAFQEKDSAIEIYFASAGATFWDIAKELRISEEMLISQNPNLTNPLDKDERIVVYYGIE